MNPKCVVTASRSQANIQLFNNILPCIYNLPSAFQQFATDKLQTNQKPAANDANLQSPHSQNKTICLEESFKDTNEGQILYDA